MRVYHSVAGSTLECITFITPDKQVVVVVMNTGDTTITFKLLDEFNGSKQALKIDALPHSIQTFIYT